MALAQEEAIRLGHNNIGTEHILLGLVREGDGIAAKALYALGLGSDKIQNEVENLIGRGQETTQTPHYTPRAKKVIELSMDEARKLGHSYVGTEHILLGLIREGESHKTILSSDCRLQLACMKPESLVIADQHAAVNTFPGLVHKHSFDCFWKIPYI